MALTGLLPLFWPSGTLKASFQAPANQNSQLLAQLAVNVGLRRDRDSNSGYPFGVYTLSRRLKKSILEGSTLLFMSYLRVICG